MNEKNNKNIDNETILGKNESPEVVDKDTTTDDSIIENNDVDKSTNEDLPEETTNVEINDESLEKEKVIEESEHNTENSENEENQEEISESEITEDSDNQESDDLKLDEEPKDIQENDDSELDETKDNQENDDLKLDEEPKDNQENDDLELDEEPKDNQENDDLEIDEEPKDIQESKDKANKPETKKNNKFADFAKKNKLLLIIIGIVLILAIAATTTVLIVNRHKIFVNDATDFEKSINNKEIYILKKDIEVDNLDLQGLDLDLNNHSLTITDTFTLDTDKEKTIDIGTIKKKEYTNAGKLIINNATIDAPNATINIYSPLTITGDITVKNFNSHSDINIAKDKSIKFHSTIANIKNNINGKVELISSNLEIASDMKITEITSDVFSKATIYGIVEKQVDGGKEISFLGNSTCPTAKNIESLYIQQSSSKVDNLTNIKNIYFVSQLEAPREINIEQNGEKFICIISEVQNCDLYLLSINDGDETVASLTSANNEVINQFDITKYINNPKDYKITAKASSTTPKIYLPSDATSINYTYTIKLDSPVLTIDDSTEGTIILSFPKVTFAEKYTIEINGNVIEKDSSDDEIENYNISDYINKVGSYSIKVVASNPDNTSFIDSDSVLISYIKTSTLSKPVYNETDSIAYEKIDDTLKIQWDKIDNAKYYVLNIKGNENKIITTSTSVTLALSDIPNNTEISVYAQGIDFYNTSETSTITYMYEELEKPTTPSYEIVDNKLTISTTAVENAQSYTLYQNGKKLSTSETATFILEENKYKDGDKFYIVANADYYTQSQSDAITIEIIAEEVEGEN